MEIKPEAILYLSDGLLRLFFMPMLLLPRRPPWFFTASSHMPIPLEVPPPGALESMPPGPPHMPTPSAHWPPMEEEPMGMPECWERRDTEGGEGVKLQTSI